MAKTKQQKSLTRWTKQKWRTASGKKSSEPERYMHRLELYLNLRVLRKVKRNWLQLTQRNVLLQRKVNSMLNMVYIKERKDNGS